MDKKKGSALKILLPLALAAAAVLVWFMLPQTKLLRAIRQGDQAAAQAIVTKADPQMGAAAQELLSAAVRSGVSDGRALDAALFAGEMTASGLDAGFAAQLAADALCRVDYSAIEKNGKAQLLGDVVAAADPARLNEALSRCLDTAESKNAPVVSALVDACAQVPAQHLVPFARVMDGRSLGGRAFLEKACAGTGPEEAAGVIAAMEGDAQAYLARAYAKTWTRTDDVLRYVYECAQLGVKPSKACPDGAALDMDLSKVAFRALPTIPALYPNTWMVVSRTEKEEPAKAKMSSSVMGDNPFALSALPLTGYEFPDDYDENDKSDPANYTVRLETAYMDDIPPQLLPRSEAECQHIVMLDMTYTCQGTLSSTETTTLNGMKTTEKAYYPVYACVQRVDVLTGEDRGIVFTHDVNVVSPPEPPKGQQTVTPEQMALRYIMNNSGSMTRKYCIAKPDEAWMNAAAKAVVDELAQRDWQLITYFFAE